ncbi:hypothetical protein NX059_012323 [Plenodomus lindquistii]|nr:hypothetical protein NX059_012323 [Plenodomus lindquistii]
MLTQLPAVVQQLHTGIRDCSQELGTLKAPRVTVREQRRHLFDISTPFSTLIKAGADDLHFDPFFGSAFTEKENQRKLCTVLQNVLTGFAVDMRKKGCKYELVDGAVIAGGRTIPRAEYVVKVKKLLERSRGR